MTLRHLHLVPDEPVAAPPAERSVAYRMTPFGLMTDEEISAGLGCTCGHQDICIHCVLASLEGGAA